MAGSPLSGESAIVTFPGAMPPMPAVARILARHDRQHLAAFIAVAIDLIDALDGDLEAEPATWLESIETRSQGFLGDDDSEAAGDEADMSWPEWQSRGRHKLYGCKSEALGTWHEDDEEDDAAGQYDEDYYTGPPLRNSGDGPGCPISDPGEDGEGGD